VNSSGGKSSTPSGSSGGGGSAEGESSDKSGAGAAGKDGGSGGQGGAGNGPGGKSDVGTGRAIAAPDQARSAQDDGSSPLVPILIVLAVLAAVSIGVVTMRGRGQGGPPGGDSSRISPEAG